MNCNPTLTANDFKTVHNALCELRDVQHSLQAVVREPIIDKLSAAIRAMEQGLKGAYEQDNNAFDRKHDYYYDFREHNQLRSTWSIYELDAPDGFLQDHPYKGATTLVYKQHWGDAGEVSAPIDGTTWGDLYRAADQCIRESGDGHHVFIESFKQVKDHPTFLKLNTGS